MIEFLTAGVTIPYWFLVAMGIILVYCGITAALIARQRDQARKQLSQLQEQPVPTANHQSLERAS